MDAEEATSRSPQGKKATHSRVLHRDLRDLCFSGDGPNLHARGGNDREPVGARGQGPGRFEPIWRVFSAPDRTPASGARVAAKDRPAGREQQPGARPAAARQPARRERGEEVPKGNDAFPSCARGEEELDTVRVGPPGQIIHHGRGTDVDPALSRRVVLDVAPANPLVQEPERGTARGATHDPPSSPLGTISC